MTDVHVCMYVYEWVCGLVVHIYISPFLSVSVSLCLCLSVSLSLSLGLSLHQKKNSDTYTTIAPTGTNSYKFVQSLEQ